MNIGVIGLGSAGARLHVPALRRLVDVEVVAACDPDISTHAQARGIAAFTDARAVIERADAVVIATPPSTHAAIARVAIDAGVHVYCEKPMTTSVHDAVEIARAAKSITFQVGYAYRFHPLWTRAISLIQKGIVQPPLQIRARFPSTGRGTGWSHPVVDTGTHHVDLVSVMTGLQPASVRATPEGFLVARWPDGSTLEGNYAPNGTADIVSIRSNHRTITIDRARGVRLRGAPFGVAALPVPSLLRARLSRSGWEQSFGYALRAFIARARDGEPATPGPHEGLEGVIACEAMLRSIASGNEEPVEVIG